MKDGHLIPKVIFAMPKGPPFGGMTTYTSVFLQSKLFADDNAFLFDTTPPQGNYNTFTRFVHSLRAIGDLVKLVRSVKPDIVYFMTSDYLGFYEKGVMGLICSFLGGGVVYHFVGGGLSDFYSSSRMNSMLIRFFLSHSHAVVVLYEDMRKLVSDATRLKTTYVIPNPVVCDHYKRSGNLHSSTNETAHILYSGAVTKEKGLLDLLEAVYAVKDLLAGSKVTIIGDGSLLEHCKKHIRFLHIDEIVELTGYVSEERKREFLDSSDIFVLPSYTEGIPISILEAMAAGCAVVSTNVGGIPSAVIHGENGLLVSPGDIDALAASLAKLVRDPQLRDAMGRNGIERAKKYFDAHIIMDQFIALFNELYKTAGLGYSKD